MNKITAILALTSLSLGSVQAATYYVDGSLGANCTASDYSISARACTGSDGNAYTTIAGGIDVLASGDIMNIRGGTYNENNASGSVDRQLPAFAAMTTVQGYLNETVNWDNPEVHATNFSLGTFTDNLTIANINFLSVNRIIANQRIWTNSSGNIWFHDDTRREIADVWRLVSDVWVEITEEASQGALDSDLEWFQDYPNADRNMYIYSDTDPNSRVDLSETHSGVMTIGRSSSSNGYVVIHDCTFNGGQHAHIKGEYQFWVYNNEFGDVGLSTLDHHIYSFGVHSLGNEAIFEHNYHFGDWHGAAYHIFKTGSVTLPPKTSPS